MKESKAMKNYVDEHGYVPRFEMLLEEVGNVCLEGESGCGKTQMVHDWCETNNVLLLETSLTADTTRWELVASDTLKAGTTEVRSGIVHKWLTVDYEKEGYDGVLMYWDGFNYAPQNVTALLESLADFRGAIRIYELEKVFTRADPKTGISKRYFVISMNPYERAGYAGTFQGNIAQRRRFETIRMDWLRMKTEIGLCQARVKGLDYDFARNICEFAFKTRSAYREGAITAPITTGNVINYCKLHMRGMGDEEIIDIACGLYLEEEAQKVRRFWVSKEEKA